MSLAPPRGFSEVTRCLLCGPAQGDLDPEPKRAVATKFIFLIPSRTSSSKESESEESPGARGEVE